MNRDDNIKAAERRAIKAAREYRRVGSHPFSDVALLRFGDAEMELDDALHRLDELESPLPTPEELSAAGMCHNLGPLGMAAAGAWWLRWYHDYSDRGGGVSAEAFAKELKARE